MRVYGEAFRGRERVQVHGVRERERERERERVRESTRDFLEEVPTAESI